MNRLFRLLSLLFLLAAACTPKPVAETARPDRDITVRGTEIPESYDQPQAYAPASVRAQRGQTNPIQLMTGVWVSEEDPLETILFTSDSYTSYYENEQIIKEQIEYEPDCQPLCIAAVAGAAACFVVRGEAGSTCYTVLYVDQNRLEMRPTGVTDVVLRYKRVS
jgi:hypothetical protein